MEEIDYFYLLIKIIFNPLNARGRGALSDIALKQMHVVIQNFLTFPKYQKQKF